MRHAIFGDIAGHYRPFRKGLQEIGVDVKNFSVPDDLVVVQVGDLVHKGPNSQLVVDLVEKMIYENPKNWVQLAGNHELPYVAGTNFFHPDRVEPDTAEKLMALHQDGKLHPSYAFTSAEGQDYLVTHAGLTRPNYLFHGGGSAFDINEALRSSDWKNLMTPGCMLGGGRANNYAGVFWAESVGEVYASWYNAPNPAPFHQIHGHSSLRQWDRNGLMRFNYAEWVLGNLSNDFDNMHTCWSHAGVDFHAVDCGLGSRAFTEVIHPLVVE